MFVMTKLYEKKFERMDEMIKNYDNMSEDDRIGFIDEELDCFIDMNISEKLQAYDYLLTNAIENKHHCIRKAQDYLKTAVDCLDIIKKAVLNNASTDDIISSIDELSSYMVDNFNSIDEEMRYCKK